MRGREHRALRPSLRRAEQRCPLGSGRVHHGSEVVDLLLEARRVRRAVRAAGVAAIEHDQSREGREALEEARGRRLLPVELDVRDPRRLVDQIERPVADDLVRDVRFTAAGELRAESHGHECARLRKALPTEGSSRAVRSLAPSSSRFH